MPCMSQQEYERLVAAAKNWEQTAKQYKTNSDYYQSLVVQIGELFGSEARTADDGTVMENVLCIKVPELVKKTLVNLKAPVAELVGTYPVVLYFGDERDRDYFEALVKEAKPGMVTKKL